MRGDNNAIKRGEKCTGRKKGAFTTDINIDEIKRVSKKLKCTVNDFFCALLSLTLHEYLEIHKEDSRNG